MAEQTWEYKGHTITLMPSANFSTTINGKYYAASSMSAAKKAIDKGLEEKAQEVKLSFPVVMLLGNSRFDTKLSIKRAVISGVERESLRVLGLDESEDGGSRTNREYVLPDTEANEVLLKEYVEANKALKSLKKRLDARTVPTHLGGYGRNSRTSYADAVKELQDGYEAAKKGKMSE